ncbi:hypothetical protein Fot_31820 [Forsythia ovata]|uniref:Uncharacterized protein n=1 Tax=Forsythia ovata TaxID=205694 RepID=A0ABD1T6M1_9LAMI
MSNQFVQLTQLIFIHLEDSVQREYAATAEVDGEKRVCGSGEWQKLQRRWTVAARLQEMEKENMAAATSTKVANLLGSGYSGMAVIAEPQTCETTSDGVLEKTTIGFC